MKKIKRLFLTVVLLALCLCCVIPFAGCKKENWVEVQSITYTTDSGSTTLDSIYRWEITSETIDESEYNSAPWELQWHKHIFRGSYTISADRNKFFIELDKFYVGKTFYSDFDEHGVCYEKFTLTEYKLYYVKVKVSKNKIEIDFEENIETITPISYEITYFEN